MAARHPTDQCGGGGAQFLGQFSVEKCIHLGAEGGVGLTFHKVGSWKISVHVALLCFERMASVWGSGAGRNQGKYGVRHMRRH
mgnify:CR=1 FL=1